MKGVMKMSEYPFEVRFSFGSNGTMIMNIYNCPYPGRWAVAKPIKLEFVVLKEEDEGKEVEPTLRMDMMMGQFFLDAFKRALVKESEGENKGRIEAMREHIEDLRKLLHISPNAGEAKPARMLRE